MFTVGIFTTHIPYIAFVVFYAWFLLFGIGKAASGEIETGEKYCKTEWVAEKHYDFSDSNSGNYYIVQSLINNHGFEEIHFKRKIIYTEILSVRISRIIFAPPFFAGLHLWHNFIQF
jgi:hypothetical protein